MRQLYELKYKPVKLYYYFFCLTAYSLNILVQTALLCTKLFYDCVFLSHAPTAVRTACAVTCAHQAELKSANHTGEEHTGTGCVV